MTVAEACTAAADELTPDGAWTQHESARRADGHAVPPCDSSAVCWCITGALYRVTADDEDAYGDALHAIDHFLESLGVEVYIPEWNDDRLRKQAEVVALLRDVAKAQGT